MRRDKTFAFVLILLFSLSAGLMLTAAQTEQGDCDSRVVFVWGLLGIHIIEAGGDGEPIFVVEEGIYPVWSPDGTQIAFGNAQNGILDIYIVNIDGSELTRLTMNNGDNLEPKWSPDGSQIAFYSNRDGNAEIYLMNADGTNQTNITNHFTHDMRPTWSPDGTQLTFISNRDGDYEIFTMNTDGTDVIQITHNTNNDYDPVWSPDGTTIAYRSATDDDYDAQVFIIPASGGTPTQITESLSDFGDLQWNNDSTGIIYLRRNRVILHPLDGSAEQILIRLPASDYVGNAYVNYYEGNSDCIIPQHDLTPTPSDG